MTLEIWKFPLTISHSQEVEMPKHAKILTIQMNQEAPCIWAAVDTAAEREKRVFITYGTGHEVREITLFPYIGTYQFQDEGLPFPLVFHVFDGGVAA